MATEAQKKATKKWVKKNKERKKYGNYKSTAKSFIKNLATKEDLMMLQNLIIDELNK